jgi:hypothetical protein
MRSRKFALPGQHVYEVSALLIPSVCLEYVEIHVQLSEWVCAWPAILLPIDALGMSPQWKVHDVSPHIPDIVDLKGAVLITRVLFLVHLPTSLRGLHRQEHQQCSGPEQLHHQHQKSMWHIERR